MKESIHSLRRKALRKQRRYLRRNYNGVCINAFLSALAVVLAVVFYSCLPCFAPCRDGFAELAKKAGAEAAGASPETRSFSRLYWVSSRDLIRLPLLRCIGVPLPVYVTLSLDPPTRSVAGIPLPGRVVRNETSLVYNARAQIRLLFGKYAETVSFSVPTDVSYSLSS